MNTGPISKDGRHQWDGEKWVAIPPPPMSGTDKAHDAFQIFLVVLIVVAVLAVLVVIFT